MDNNFPRDMVYFVLSLVAIWFGTSVAAREIIRERPVYTRERMVNLGLFPYLSSKLLVLGFIVCLQCCLLFVPLKLLDLIGLMKMQGEFFGIPQFWAMILTAGVGLAIGLFVSATVKTSEMATSLVPLILIPQILFSGLIGVPTGFSKVVGLTMPATWSFDTMKRFSTLDTLKEEGSDERSENLGLYKFIEKKNDKIIADTKKDIDDYKKDAEDKISESIRSNQIPTLDNPPKPKDTVKFPTDLSEYVNFLHPWMHEVLNQIVLMLMFLSLCILTLIVLKLQDIS
jgi:ABC transport system ATP-binding/permease protein